MLTVITESIEMPTPSILESPDLVFRFLSNPSYTQVDIGYAYCGGSTYGSYWTLQFGP